MIYLLLLCPFINIVFYIVLLRYCPSIITKGNYFGYSLPKQLTELGCYTLIGSSFMGTAFLLLAFIFTRLGYYKFTDNEPVVLYRLKEKDNACDNHYHG